MPKKRGRLIRITDEAYDYLEKTLKENPKLRYKGTVISNLITTFLSTSLKWCEDMRAFQIAGSFMYIDLIAYLKYLEKNPQAKIPLIEALCEIADATTWRKFGETLEAYNKEAMKP